MTGAAKGRVEVRDFRLSYDTL
ncbi:MAG: hypothetical protein QOI40_102, partial [Alphaproteobacteria bacterium]|nr:hypothetical protein [Alphaproteobacteria bacterium]